jgi:L-ribulose-5-phosphate 4-epimerase
MLKALKQEVCRANRELVPQGLVTLTWGNVSGIDRRQGLVVIKPSGVPYDELDPSHMVVVDLDGEVVQGDLRPSSDTPTHVLLYRELEWIGGVTHTHSCYATMFAQARREIPCLGTTHADHFAGNVPLTRGLTPQEVDTDYERNTGCVIVERFADLDHRATPAILVAGHGPFTWGSDAYDSLHNAVALEAVAKMAHGTWQLQPQAPSLEPHILQKHFRRKHGPDAYYGQK